MTHEELSAVMNDLIRKHLKLPGWTFAWSGARRRLGSCTGETRTIRLSKYIVTASEAQQVDTALHEIAHAIDFERRGRTDHGDAWKRICVEVGARPERLAHDTGFTTPIKYTAVCACGRSLARHRMRRGGVTYYCPCGRAVAWSVNY